MKVIRFESFESIFWKKYDFVVVAGNIRGTFPRQFLDTLSWNKKSL
jgi:hypothetical protein